MTWSSLAAGPGHVQRYDDQTTHSDYWGFTQNNWMIPLAKWEYQTRWPKVRIDLLPEKNTISVDDTIDNQLIIVSSIVINICLL